NTVINALLRPLLRHECFGAGYTTQSAKPFGDGRGLRDLMVKKIGNSHETRHIVRRKPSRPILLIPVTPPVRRTL
ncbi:MAG TPA: hypothetical protein VL329_08200, partial [Nitrospiraceae bacterium]|nr:hypothetical protein [Nitrospiraceae bacterium]